MKEMKVTITLTLHADEHDKELRDEAVYENLLELMEAQDLSYKFKVLETEDEEEYEEEEFLDE